MARDRKIKPDFWTSEDVAVLSVTCRLMFIGMWNFSDDSGIHVASTKKIKMEIFPADELSDDQIISMIKELLDQNLLVEYPVGDKKYWRITGWHHQKIEYPTYIYPLESGEIPDSPKRGAKKNESSTPVSRHVDDKSSTSNNNVTELSATTSRQDNDMSLLSKVKLNKERNIYKENSLPIFVLTEELIAWGKNQPEKLTEAEMKKGFESFNLTAATRDKPFADLEKAFKRFMLADHGYLLRQRSQNGEVDEKAGKAWEIASKAAGNAQKAALLDDSFIQQAVKKIGGWSVLGHASPFENSTIWRPKFIAAYREACQ